MEEILTLEEVAQYLKLSVHTLYKMAQQGRIPALKAGDQWRFNKIEIENWMKQQGKESQMGARVVSIINLKGGVGKTTITVALAEFLALEHRKKVLVVDLDPQTNATVALIDEAEWARRNKKGETIYQLFKDKIDDTAQFHLEKSICKGVSNLRGGIPNLDLLPSSLDFIDIQDRLIMITTSSLVRPADVLREEVQGILKEYDFVLIDCPPNLGLITQNGLNISQYYLIPVIPDILSTYGIPSILKQVDKFSRKVGSSIKPLGIVISKKRSLKLHNSTMRILKEKAAAGEYPRIFETVFPESYKFAEAMDVEANVNTLKQKYGYGDHYQILSELTREFLRYV